MARQRKNDATPPPIGVDSEAGILTEAPGLASDPQPDPEPPPAPDANAGWRTETGAANLRPETGAADRRVSAWPMILGGIVAAAIGGGTTFATLRAWPDLIGPSDISGLDLRIADQNQRIGELGEALAALPSPAALSGTGAEELIGPIETRLSALEADLKRIADRLAVMEKRPATTVAASPDLAAATAAMKEAEAQALKLKEEAAALARQAALSDALSRIEGALESGQSLTAGLNGLRQAGVALPEALTATEQGAPTLQALREAFPDAARASIAESVAAETQDTTWGRISAFLQAQTGSRSLSPREGDDPDAILSRAEAALASGDLAAAIAETNSLPPEGQGAMQDWLTLATRRLAATEALATLRAGGQP